MSDQPRIKPFEEITPLVYAWTTPDIPKYQGWEKIGYTEQSSADKRIEQQASQLRIKKKRLWSHLAMFTSEHNISFFKDHDLHAYLEAQGVEREPGSEWFRFGDEGETSLLHYSTFSRGEVPLTRRGQVQEDYQLREEQVAAVDLAVAAFAAGHRDVLWNAKPRFGKTLTTYDLARRMDARNVLVLTNRPAVATSWFADFQRFIGHQTQYQFVSEVDALKGVGAMARAAWREYSREHQDARCIEFVSLQDLKGARAFGGAYDKLGHLPGIEWDLLVVDEAHEGKDTLKTEVALERLTYTHALHLSGTPFKALASGEYADEQVFHWTYADEQLAKECWDDEAQENPYLALPRLNLLTYQVSPMLQGLLASGTELEDESSVSFAFTLSEFFKAERGFFVHEDEVARFLDRLTDPAHEKYPFSTPELREEIRHSFWLVDRVESAKALAKMLRAHPVFGEYEVVMVAGDGKSLDGAAGEGAEDGEAFARVRAAIDRAEKADGKTITISAGRLTTGVTVPEWTAVVMLSTMSSPAQYMQAAFRAQNGHTFVRGGRVLQKREAYVFDFAPERTLQIFDQFANDLSTAPATAPGRRQEAIEELLNFFPVIAEDSGGRMEHLDAEQVLAFPHVAKAREVVRCGFMSNHLFANVGGIFRQYAEAYADTLDQLPSVAKGKAHRGPFEVPEDMPELDEEGNAVVDTEVVVNPKVAELGPAVFRREAFDVEPQDVTQEEAVEQFVERVLEQTAGKREQVSQEYDLGRREQKTEERVLADQARKKAAVLYEHHRIEQGRLEQELEQAPTKQVAAEVAARIEQENAAFAEKVAEAGREAVEGYVEQSVARNEQRSAQKKADEVMESFRSRLRGFARTIPMFLMAYGDENMRLANFDDYTPDEVFEEITGITEAQFRELRDGKDVQGDDGSTTRIPGLLDEQVFDASIQEFLAKKAVLADYFDPDLEEDIFAYIPRQQTNLVFTPRPVVNQMLDDLEADCPGIFSDPDRTFADLFSTAGLFLMEIVRRLNKGLERQIPDQQERLRHILTHQVFEMSHNEILHEITKEALAGGVPERREWVESSGHYVFGNMSTMTLDEIRSAFGR